MVAIVGLLLITLGGVTAPTQDDKLVTVIRNAYASNRGELTHGEAKFRMEEGSADSVGSALKGKWAERWSTAEGLLIFDTGISRYECVHPLAQIVAHRVKGEDNSYTMPLTESIRAVTNGSITLSDRIFVESDGKTPIHGAQIDPGTQGFARYYVFPLSVGNPAPADFQLDVDLSTPLPGRPSWQVASVDVNATLRGIPVVKLVLTSRGVSREYWVDLERGAVPLLIRDGADVEYHYGDVRRVGDRAWLPHRLTILGKNPTGAVRIRDVTVTEADFTTRPAKSSYGLRFPKPRKMVNAASMKVYDEQDTWDITALPAANSPRARTIQMGQPQAPVPILPRERETRSSAPQVWMIAAGTLSVLGLGLIARRMSHGRSTA